MTRRLLLLVLVGLSLSPNLPGNAASAPAPARVVAIADVHGASDAFVALLTRTGLIDGQRRWIGGKTVLVQTGDVTDRGPGVREVLDLLMKLEKEAAAAGGKVHVLVGNHEVMNMVGDIRDAAPEVVTQFGGEQSYRAAFAAAGKYGKWLRGKPILVEINGTVFMHAGLDLTFSVEPLDAQNRRVRKELEEWDAGLKWLRERNLVPPSAPFADVALAARAEILKLNAAAAEDKLPDDAPKIAALLLPVANIQTSSLFRPDGPLWFRGFATWDDVEGASRMTALLKHYRVKRFVTGHSVQAEGRISERFGGALFLIDTGMLGGRYWPKGRPSALEIAGDKVTAVYLE